MSAPRGARALTLVLAGVLTSAALTGCTTGQPEPAVTRTVTVTAPAPTITVTVTATPQPSASAASATPTEPASDEVWSRYGPLVGTSAYTDDYVAAFAPSICADVAAGKIETGFTHGFITGGNLPDHVRPQATFVWAAARAIELGCPDLSDDFIALLDAYDAKYGPYD